MKSDNRMTLTRQAAARLESLIYRGVYPPDSPLPGTRKLAGDFRVSQRIILRALDILEKKDILVRQERRRVYVKARSLADNAREILFFAFGDHLGEHGIYQSVNRMILDEGRRRRFDFFSRVISSADALSETRLDRELARLENLGFIDAALVYCFLNERQMEKFAKLPYPVIFIGELPDSGILPEGARLISPNSKDMLLETARYAVRKHYSRLAMVYWRLPARHRYEKEAFTQLKKFCSALNMPLELIPVEGGSIREAGTIFETRARKIACSLPEGTLLVTHNIHSERFDSGELLPPEEYPALDLLTHSLPHGSCRIKHIRRDFSEIRQAIADFIENTGTERHRIADYHYRITDPDDAGQEETE